MHQPPATETSYDQSEFTDFKIVQEVPSYVKGK